MVIMDKSEQIKQLAQTDFTDLMQLSRPSSTKNLRYNFVFY